MPILTEFDRGGKTFDGTSSSCEKIAFQYNKTLGAPSPPPEKINSKKNKF
jgi:hypothetical protein